MVYYQSQRLIEISNSLISGGVNSPSHEQANCSFSLAWEHLQYDPDRHTELTSGRTFGHEILPYLRINEMTESINRPNCINRIRTFQSKDTMQFQIKGYSNNHPVITSTRNKIYKFLTLQCKCSNSQRKVSRAC